MLTRTYATWALVGTLAVAGTARSQTPAPSLAPAPALSHWLGDAATGVRVEQSTAVVFFLDPGFYYKVDAPAAALARLVAAHRLEASPIGDFACRAALEPPTPSPSPVEVRWWTPRQLKAPQCYQGRVGGNIVYVIYVATTRTAFIYVQNT